MNSVLPVRGRGEGSEAGGGRGGAQMADSAVQAPALPTGSRGTKSRGAQSSPRRARMSHASFCMDGRMNGTDQWQGWFIKLLQHWVSLEPPYREGAITSPAQVLDRKVLEVQQTPPSPALSDHREPGRTRARGVKASLLSTDHGGLSEVSQNSTKWKHSQTLPSE